MAIRYEKNLCSSLTRIDLKPTAHPSVQFFNDALNTFLIEKTQLLTDRDQSQIKWVLTPLGYFVHSHDLFINSTSVVQIL